MGSLQVKITQTISSREVAEMMEVTHNNLLRKIDNHTEILEKVTELNFDLSDLWQLSSYKDSTGRTLKEYQVTKKGCEFLAHKTTGEKGDLFTIRYMNKFEEMEEYIKAMNQPSYMIEDPIKRAEKWIEEQKEKQQLEDKNKELEEENEGLATEIGHKNDVIEGLTEDISLADKRQRITQIIKYNANGRYTERYGLLYEEFEKKYHMNLKTRMNNLVLKTEVLNVCGSLIRVTKKLKENKMEYIDKVLGMIPELYEVACKVFENDIEELKKEWEVIINRKEEIYGK